MCADPRRNDGGQVNRHRTLAVLTVALAVALSACGTSQPRSEQPMGVRLATAAPGAPPTLDQGLANLDPDLLDAVQDATRDARADGVDISVTSGWRSRAHQARLYDDAVREHGSEEEARRWVATPDTSEHVTGDAVDLGPRTADAWLVEHGADYGLCQVYANEPWHFELRTEPGGTCPGLLPDGSYA